jgi:hypothetical protein
MVNYPKNAANVMNGHGWLFVINVAKSYVFDVVMTLTGLKGLKQHEEGMIDFYHLALHGCTFLYVCMFSLF